MKCIRFGFKINKITYLKGHALEQEQVKSYLGHRYSSQNPYQRNQRLIDYSTPSPRKGKGY
jgi:hypothetical protein